MSKMKTAKDVDTSSLDAITRALGINTAKPNPIKVKFSWWPRSRKHYTYTIVDYMDERIVNGNPNPKGPAKKLVKVESKAGYGIQSWSDCGWNLCFMLFGSVADEALEMGKKDNKCVTISVITDIEQAVHDDPELQRIVSKETPVEFVEWLKKRKKGLVGFDYKTTLLAAERSLKLWRESKGVKDRDGNLIEVKFGE